MNQMKQWAIGLLGVMALGMGIGCGAPGPAPIDTTPDPAEDAYMSPISGNGTIRTMPDGSPTIEGITQAEFDAYKLVDQYPEVFPDSLPAPITAVSGILEAWNSGMSVEDAHRAVVEDVAASPLPEGDIGITRAAWHSALYHGISTLGGACYSDVVLNNTVDCWFPKYKSWKITTLQHHVGNVAICAPSTIATYPGTKATPAQATDIENAFLSGYLDNRNTFPGAVISNVMPANGLALENTFSCSPVNALALTVAYFPQGAHSQSGLAGNPRSAFQYTHVDTSINPMAMFVHVVDGCHETPTSDILHRYARYSAVHELLHSMGFAHFTKGVMKAFQGCGVNNRTDEDSINATTALVTQAFRDAIGIYSGGHENDNGDLHDTNLIERGPLDGDAQDEVNPNIDGD